MAVADSAVFELLDVLGGATELVKPNATLDGSLPLRATRACSPLLDGNRFGFQVQLTQKLTFDKTLAGIKLASIPEGLSRAISGSMPRVLAEKLLVPGGMWAQSFAQGIVVRERGHRRRISVFTGLFVRPRKGYCLRVGDAGNRRHLSFVVEERWIAHSNVFTPLVVTLTFHPDTPFPLTLSGEIATLAPLVPNAPWTTLEGDDLKTLGHAHVAFFDAPYFAQKKRASTKKYRQMVDKDPPPTLKNQSTPGWVALGPAKIHEGSAKLFLTPQGVESAAPSGAGDPASAELIFCNSIPLACSFDGHHTHVEPNKAELDRFARETRQAWTNVFGSEFLDEHKGAMWYFTKYVTPHQPGEPYFFVKPPALIATPPGYSTLIEGIAGPGYSILRGVVATDVFHALPAVFRVDRPLHKIHIPAGTALTKFIPFPRRLMDATFRVVEWDRAPRLRGAS